ncbi:MAG: radical SAM protein [Lachnospiraceae bacterium]|nr:radical SAM protein [Lachnospiraceae bacterium]
MHYTGTIWRPPYEAYSALVQVTAGCTHHKCKFCTLYEDVPFKFRMSPLSEVEADLKEISRYQRNADRVFFTGANPFVLSFDKLKTLAELVKKYYPKVKSIGCFARITDITPKTTEQLRELREMGYNSLTIGAEAGDDASLEFMNKGFGTKEIITESKRLDEVGMDYNYFYLAGIYGANRGKIGAKNTAEVFNQVNPKIIVSSMLTIYPTSELYQEIQEGNWKEETEIEKLYELRTLIQQLDIPTYFATMGASNCINVEGRLPKDREKMVAWLDKVIGSVDEKELRRYREHLPHL